MNNKQDEEMFKVMRDYDDLLTKLHQEQEEKDAIPMGIIKNEITNYKYKKLLEFLLECGLTREYEIVTRKDIFGEKQTEAYWFKHVWVTQHTGYVCDHYHGTIFIPITDTMILKFNFEC